MFKKVSDLFTLENVLTAYKNSDATPCMSARARSKKKQMIGQLAIARALPGFNDHFSFGGSFSLLIFYY